ncbi:MAG: universal stress protein [Euryarchaeota archaeon]|nr:universal stress protein [Euryarchaeota archaeon]
MATNTGAFHPAEQIVVPVQGTDREFLAQQWAVEIAAALELPVRAVHVSGDAGDGAPDKFDYLEKLAKKHGVELKTEVIHGSDVVRELVDELGARDLVVLGTRKLSHQYHIGSVAAALVEKAPCPVQIVRLE